MWIKLDRFISVICVILACVFLAYNVANSFLTNDGTTFDKIITVLDSSSSFSKDVKDKIEMMIKSGKDKKVIENVKKYIESDDEDGLEKYLQEILNDQSNFSSSE